MTNTITLPRALVERALKALEKSDRISGYRNNWAAVNSLIAALEQPQVEQEPVAWVDLECWRAGTHDAHDVFSGEAHPGWTPLYTRPQPPRQPLTDDEINNMDVWLRDTPFWRVLKLARAIEAAHGIGGDA